MYKKRIITVIVSVAMFCMMAMTAFADTGVHISLPKDQVWTSGQAVSRTGNYSYVSVSLDSVYPTSGSDYCLYNGVKTLALRRNL